MPFLLVFPVEPKEPFFREAFPFSLSFLFGPSFFLVKVEHSDSARIELEGAYLCCPICFTISLVIFMHRLLLSLKVFMYSVASPSRLSEIVLIIR